MFGLKMGIDLNSTPAFLRSSQHSKKLLINREQQQVKILCLDCLYLVEDDATGFLFRSIFILDHKLGFYDYHSAAKLLE